MKTLPNTFSKNTFDYQLVSRDGDVAIYSQTMPETGKLIGYEVFEVQKKEAFSLNGYDYPAKEAVPSANQWGQMAFTVFDLSRAKQRQAELLQRIEVRSIENS